MTPNPQVEGSAEQRSRCSVPVALRAPAPPHLQRWASGKRVSRFIVGESRSRRWLQQLLRKEAAAAKSV